MWCAMGERKVMGLLNRLFGNNAKKYINAQEYFKTLTAYQPAFTNWGGALFESDLVRAAIDARARHISKLKFEIMGMAKPALRSKMKHAPNEFQTWSQFLYRTSVILDMQNNVFLVPVIGEFGETTGFFPVLPNRCELVQVQNVPFLRYQFMNGDTAAIELDRCGIMTKFQYTDDFFGENNNVLNPTMNLIHMGNQAITEAVKNSSTYRFMARLNNFSTSEDIKKERRRFSRENLSNEADGGGILLFPNTYSDIRQLDSKPYNVDAEQAKLIRENVMNYFAVSESVIRSEAYGDAWQAFYESVVEVFAVQFSEVMTKAVFTLREQTNGNAIMLTANRLQYVSTAEKQSICMNLIDRGIISINEAREIFNMTPVEGGDVRAIRGEYKNADALNKTPVEENGDEENEA